ARAGTGRGARAGRTSARRPKRSAERRREAVRRSPRDARRLAPARATAARSVLRWKRESSWEIAAGRCIERHSIDIKQLPFHETLTAARAPKPGGRCNSYGTAV